MSLAPIVLFVYNRLWHTQQTIEALQKNILASDSELFIYSDGAKSIKDEKDVDEVRRYIKTIDGFKNITIVEREKNFGLANSVIDGVTTIVNRYGKIIVLEDDLVTSPYFLNFMNESLEKYKDQNNVYSISAYSFSDKDSGLDSTYFLSLTNSWGWATWSEKWSVFKRDKTFLSKVLQNSFDTYRFNYDDSYNYTQMVKSELDSKIDSWAIYWYFSVYEKKGLTLYPAESLVRNIGFDGSGTNCGVVRSKNKNFQNYSYILTDNIYEKKENRSKVSSILKSNRPTLIRRIMSKVKIFLKGYLSYKSVFFLSLFISKLKLIFLKKDIGVDTYIDKTVNVYGWNHVSVGSHTLIGERTWININDRAKNFKHIKIGDGCYIGRNNLISSAKEIIISDYVMTNNDCKFLGSNHVYQNPLKPYISTGTTKSGILKIGPNVWIGAGCSILGSVEVGYGSIIGASSVVTKDISPFSIAVGNPCKVIKRFDFNSSKWIEISKFNKDMEKLMPSEEEYLKILNDNKPKSMPIMAATSRYGDLF